MSETVPLGRPISVRLPEDLRQRIEALAKLTRRSQGDVVREVLERDLAQLEWEQRIAQAAVDMRAGRVQSVSLEELGLTGTAVDPGVSQEIH